MPPSPKLYLKSCMPKVMFVSVCAKQRPEYGFNGKVAIWSFTAKCPAKRNNDKIGTVVGLTMILKEVRVDLSVYFQKIISKHGTFSRMPQELWWFHRDA